MQVLMIMIVFLPIPRQCSYIILTITLSLSPILTIIAAAYGLIASELKEESEGNRHGFLQLMTFLIIVEVLNLFNYFAVLRKRMYLDLINHKRFLGAFNYLLERAGAEKSNNKNKEID